jgi:UDP-N-acetylmuramoyl-L-alanyl-D-glutamate--2,6-diaminopimelate ligase
MMEKRLSEFFTPEAAQAAGFIGRSNASDPLVTGLEYDSRKLQPGNIYFALPGLHTDGHRYIDQALAKGAAVIFHSEEIPEKRGDAVFIQVKDSRYAMSPVSAAFYGFPSRRLIVCGVTGTEGKSTTVYLIYQLLRLLGRKAGFLSTVQYSTGGEPEWNPEHQTTPEANAVQRILWQMAENGVKYAVLEASSHGLSLRTNRLGDVDFDAAVFTNVTHEHLEFHGTWEQYREDKANLFRALNNKAPKADELLSLPVPEPFGVINADDPSADFFADAAEQRTVSFSTRGMEADLSLQSIESSAWGNWYCVHQAGNSDTLEIRDQLPGAFNAGNVLAALLTVSGLLGIPVQDIAPLVQRLKPVRGRMTAIDQGQPFELLVDYAHTPSSFQTIFPPLRARINSRRGRIISIFGSAGERDTQKRSEQGRIAAAYSDIIVLTDEDPRGDAPLAILEEIAAGFETATVCEADSNCKCWKRGENLFLIPDRPAAVRKALVLAKSGDLVLLLGKGHENSIIYAEKTMPYDEIREAETALAEMGYG